MHRHTLTWIIIFGVIAVMFVQLPQIAAKHDAVLTTYSALVEVDALARQKFVERITDDRLVDGAIRGMMLQLDRYSGYISPEELPAFRRRTRGDFIGVGVALGVRDGNLTIIAPIAGSPAAQAGARPGDIIVSIDGTDVSGLSVFDVEELLGGTPGTPVEVRVKHAGHHEPQELTIVRGPVVIHTVSGCRRSPDGDWGYLIDHDQRIGYIRVSVFLGNTMHKFNTVLRALRAQGMRGLVLDLRFDPGGLMHQAVSMVDRFIDDGLILSTVTRRRAVQEYYATQPGSLTDIELVVLVNAASASSAEIVAGALQDHGRAVIVGERSFGKGSVQHLILLTGHEAAVKITVAYYRLPKGRIIHRGKKGNQDVWGIWPDVVVSLSAEERAAIVSSRQSLDFPSPSEYEPTAVASDRLGGKGFAVGAGSHLSREIHLDRQLDTALTIIRQRLKVRRGTTPVDG